MKPKPARFVERYTSSRTDYPYAKIVKKFVRTEANPILAEIYKKEQNDPIGKSLVNYIIVRTVSIFECYLLSRAGQLADANKRTASELFTFVRLDKPIGDQVASTFSFTDIKSINFIFSKLLGIDFLNTIKKESVDYYNDYKYENEHIPHTIALHKNWDNVMKIIEYRHDIVHHNKLFDMPYGRIRNLVGGTLQFFMCCVNVIR